MLIAQLSTAAGIRAPLAHVADQVFVDLAREIERQGVSRKVVADMFGLALRSYQKRVQRLSESASTRHRTLWEAIYDFACEHESVSRKRIDERFKNDPSEHVAAVLNDLVGSGLLYASARGREALYRVVTAAERKASDGEEDLESLAALIWVAVFRRQASSLSELRAMIAADDVALRRAIEQLVSSKRLTRSGAEHDPALEATTFLVPIGAEHGWEAAVFDHFRCVATAIASKIARGPRSAQDDVVGGATLSFDVYPGHPHEAEVYGLLARMRGEVNELWGRVSGFNKANTPPETKTTVSFYFGQNVEQVDAEEVTDEGAV